MRPSLVGKWETSNMTERKANGIINAFCMLVVGIAIGVHTHSFLNVFGAMALILLWEPWKVRHVTNVKIENEQASKSATTAARDAN